MKRAILSVNPVGSSQVNLIRELHELVEYLIHYKNDDNFDHKVTLCPEEYDLLLEYMYSLRKYTTYNSYDQKYDNYSQELFFYGYYGRVLVKKDACFVEYEDVTGFFGFSSVGTEIAS